MRTELAAASLLTLLQGWLDEVEGGSLIEPSSPRQKQARKEVELLFNDLILIHDVGQSVLQHWVTKLPLRAQGTLLTGIRGCDLVPKYPLDSVERRLVAALRFAVLNPADPREVDVEPGCFFSAHVPQDFRASAVGHYPQHWVAHIMHCAEVVGYCHPDEQARLEWEAVYLTFVEGMHLEPETKEGMMERLTEDRIATGTVVS